MFFSLNERTIPKACKFRSNSSRFRSCPTKSAGHEVGLLMTKRWFRSGKKHLSVCPSETIFFPFSWFRLQASGMGLFYIRVNVKALVTGSITKWSPNSTSWHDQDQASGFRLQASGMGLFFSYSDGHGWGYAPSMHPDLTAYFTYYCHSHNN